MAICSLLPDGDGVAPFCQHFRSIKCEERFNWFNQMASMEVTHPRSITANWMLVMAGYRPGSFFVLRVVAIQ